MAEDVKEGPPGPDWFAIRNQYGHLSAVYPLRAWTVTALGFRSDKDKCKLVRVKVTVTEVVS
jgi:hypothetical protein